MGGALARYAGADDIAKGHRTRASRDFGVAGTPAAPKGLGPVNYDRAQSLDLEPQARSGHGFVRLIRLVAKGLVSRVEGERPERTRPRLDRLPLNAQRAGSIVSRLSEKAFRAG